jgi:hypothetical protein
VTGDTTSAQFQIRVVETTLYCPWFLIGTQTTAFSLLRNTTDAAITAVVTWRRLAGVSVGTTTAAIEANGTGAFSASDFVSVAVTPNGSIEVAHTGAPDALQGVTTTLAIETGLSFDALCTTRRPW